MNRKTLLIFFCGLMQAQAVIVGGTMGTGTNNASESSLNSYLSSTAYSPFPYYANLVRVGSASGVYLGWNYDTDQGWIMSAEHVGAPATIGIGGVSYTVAAGGAVAGSDIRIHRVDRGVNPIPVMPSVPLASVGAMVGEFSLMTGRASTSDTISPFDWVAPGVSDAVPSRWATNTISLMGTINLGTVEVPNVHTYLVTDFDGPGHPGVTDFDGQAASGDSGGGLFVYRSGQWELSGVAHFVDDGPTFGVTAGAVDPSEYGDFSAYTDVFQHRTTILGATGVLIPEASTMCYGLAGMMLLFRRRVKRA
jgi:hypothetical protein